MSAAAWQKRISDGQRRAIKRWGHLSAAEVRDLGRRGKIQVHVAEFLIARRNGIERA